MILTKKLNKWIELHTKIFSKATPELQLAKFVEEQKEVIAAETKKEIIYELIDRAVASIGVMRFYRELGNILLVETINILRQFIDVFDHKVIEEMIDDRFELLSKRTYDKEHFKHL